ncbi:MAG TPA: hemerythrin domain-containing protein [Mycobacteriales bacterium]|nr:hemerythrin domain-containing protein [Mycobacteriales bacterium]
MTATRKTGAAAPPSGDGMPEPDVVDLLVAQHAMIHDLFTEAAASHGERCRQVVARLVRLLAVHETAEEEAVHPLARRVIPQGAEVVDDRLHEENQAKQLLERLDGMDPDDPEFRPLLDDLRRDVLRHARHEERYEFNWLRQRCSPAQLEAAARAVRAAEAVAPTHPHAGAETGGKAALAGPVLSLADRVRDAIRGSRDG